MDKSLLKVVRLDRSDGTQHRHSRTGFHSSKSFLRRC